MAAIKIRSAVPEDVDELARIHYEALDRFHEFYAAFYNNHPRVFTPKLTKRALARPSEIFLVAEDESSGSPVGFIRYVLVDPVADKSKEQEKPAEPEGESLEQLLATKEHMKDLFARFNKRQDEMDECYEKTAKEQRHAYVKHLMVDPAHQRKGIGGKLLSAVTARSDAEGIPTFIISSAESHGLYVRLGFEELGRFAIDNGHWAEEIVRIERELGIEGNETLAERYEGASEVEHYLVRWPKS